jgi:hypothetical protein
VRALILLAALLCPLRLNADEDGKIQRTLARLRLGQSFKSVQKIYQPKGAWPVTEGHRAPESRGFGHYTEIKRYKVERAQLKTPDPKIDTLWLGFDGRSLVEIHAIYDAEYTREMSSEALAADWALIYGQPKRSDEGRYSWEDRRTVMRIFDAAVPLGKDKTRVELRTSVQLMDADLFERVD